MHCIRLYRCILIVKGWMRPVGPGTVNFLGSVEKTSSCFPPKLKLWGSNATNLQMCYKVHHSTVSQNNVDHLAIFNMCWSFKTRAFSFFFFFPSIICVFQQSQIRMKHRALKTAILWCTHFSFRKKQDFSPLKATRILFLKKRQR